MHSGVFASTPESAGDVAAAFVSSHGRGPVREAEVVDVDEDAVRAGTISTRLYGAACVPDDRLRVPGAKRSADGAGRGRARRGLRCDRRLRSTRAASTCSGRARRRAA